MDVNTNEYLAFCGGENVGKSTHIKLLKEVYPDALFVKEPGSYQDRLAEQDRELALNKENGVEGEELELRLQTSRARQMRKIIKPALIKGQTVISDRSWLDGVLYASCIENADSFDICKLSKYAVQEIFPKNYIFVTKTGKTNRESNKNDRYDNQENSINPRIESGYNNIRYLIGDMVDDFYFFKFNIDMNKSQEENQIELRKLVKGILGY